MMDEVELRAQLEQLHPVSYGWAISCCAHDAQKAEDVLQIAYLKVLDGRARFARQSSFKTWLFAVIRRTAADERRRTWLRQIRLAAFGANGDHPVHAAAADESTERAELQMLFAQKLAALPKRQREVLHLVFYQDLSVEQAASVMGVSVGSARTHYERGKQRLRQWLTKPEVLDENGLARRQNQAALH